MTALVPPQTHLRLLLTIPEAAQALGVSRSILHQLVLAGDVASVKIGRSRRIAVVALETYVTSQIATARQER
jgi:excisionase family DNA binding protein